MAAVAGALGVGSAGFLPWSRTGRPRSGLELARTLHEVGLATGGLPEVVSALFLFTPLMAAATCVAVLCRRAMIAAALAAGAGAVGVASALLLMASSLRADWGVQAAMVSGAVALAGAAALGLSPRADEGAP